jgi:hypothetical protein
MMGVFMFRLKNCPFCGSARELPPLKDDGIDRTGAFAIGEDTAWWLALHQLLKRLEEETVLGARTRIKDTNECIAAVGAGEGIALVRRRLMETRAYALSQAKQDSQAVKSAWD